MSRRVVYASGCWDLFHVGHLFFLEEATKLGDVLVVGVNTDEFMSTYKPGPVIPFEARRRIVASLLFVDVVEPHDSFDDLAWIDEHGATIRAVGPEFGLHEGQRQCLDEMKREGVEIVVIPWGPDSSSRQIKEDCCEKMVAGRACPLQHPAGRLQASETAHVRHYPSGRGEPVAGTICPAR